jgi:hypothetical protein
MERAWINAVAALCGGASVLQVDKGYLEDEVSWMEHQLLLVGHPHVESGAEADAPSPWSAILNWKAHGFGC